GAAFPIISASAVRRSTLLKSKEVGDELQTSRLVGGDGSPLGRNHVAPLSHAEKAARDRLGGCVGVCPAIDRLLAMSLETMVIRTHVVRQLVELVREEVLDPLAIDGRWSACLVEHVVP